jgi:hypothetical protein
LDATLLLCDSAEAINGKLYIMGGGWNILFAPGTPVRIALGILLAVPWNETNQRRQLRIELLTSDGEVVHLNGNEVAATAEFDVGRPPGIKPGSTLNAPFALNFDGLILDVGGYEFVLKVGDEMAARRAFQVLPRPNFPPGMVPG